MSPQTFLTCFKKPLHAVKLLDNFYEKELDDKEDKILLFYSVPQDDIWDCIYHGQHDFDIETLSDFKNFFNAITTLIHQRRMIHVMAKAKPLLSYQSFYYSSR